MLKVINNSLNAARIDNVCGRYITNILSKTVDGPGWRTGERTPPAPQSSRVRTYTLHIYIFFIHDLFFIFLFFFYNA